MDIETLHLKISKLDLGPGDTLMISTTDDLPMEFLAALKNHLKPIIDRGNQVLVLHGFSQVTFTVLHQRKTPRRKKFPLPNVKR